MRMLTIFYFALARNFRDTSSLLQMTLLPLLLILILGTALNSFFQPESLEPVAVGYLNEDRGQAGAYFERFILSDEVKEILAVRPEHSLEEALSKLREGEYAALVHVPEDFSSGMLPAGKAALRVTVAPNLAMEASIVGNVLDSFIHGANAAVALQQLGTTEVLYSYGGAAIVEQPLAASGVMPGAMDYYAVTMLVMIIMYGSLYACYGMRESYLDAVGRRIKGSPVRGAEHYAGLVLANVVTVFLQLLLVLAITGLVYKVNWGDNLPLILLIAFSLVLLSISLGTMVAMVARNEMVAGGVLNIFIPVSTYIAGGYFKIASPGPVFNALQHLSPNNLAQTAIFNTIYGGPVTQTAFLLGLMVLFILVTFAIAMVAERRRLA